MLTLLAVVWLPNKTIPFLSKCDAMWAGPVSLAIINFALFMSEINVFIFTGSLLSRTIFPFSWVASLISLGPGAKRIGYLFLYSCFNFWINSLK